MDNRIVLTFLFVMLAGGFMGTYAQSTNATTTGTAATTASTAATTAASTAATTAASTAATTAASTAATTAVSTASTASTTASPITFNNTVTNLTTTISASNCSKTELCARQPTGCDPSTGTGCFFLGVQQLSGQNFGFALSGDSDGYIAAILSRNATLGNNDTAYICAKNNGAVKFFSARLNSGTLNNATLSVGDVKGKINGSKIQCTFSATVPDSTKSSATVFSLSVATGPYNANNDSLGSPTAKITTNPVDLSNVSATITNQITNTTATTPTTATTANAVTIQQSLMQALLITVGVLSLAML